MKSVDLYDLEESKEEIKENSQSKKSSVGLSEDINIYDMFDNDPEGFDSTQIIPNGEVQVWNFKNSNEMSSFLSNYCPTEIILLDPHLQFIRWIELYNSRQIKQKEIKNQLKLTTLFYKDTSEKFYHESIIHKEKKSFENLIYIKDKEFINIVDPKFEEEQTLKRDQENEKFSTAQGGKRSFEVGELIRTKIIVVDMREFSSSTPQYLYDAGFLVVPLQISVGDYILSDRIAVEK